MKAAFVATIMYMFLALCAKPCKQGWVLLVRGCCIVPTALVGMALDDQFFSSVARLLLPKPIFDVVRERGIHSSEPALARLQAASQAGAAART